MMSLPLAENLKVLAMNWKRKLRTQQNATPNHVTMISQREKATGGISNVSKHLWSGLIIW